LPDQIRQELQNRFNIKVRSAYEAGNGRSG
jgi:hypothetical protein